MGKSSRYIGSSDAPPILGVPSYGTTALDVWERMVGLAPTERDVNAPMRWGTKLEPLILEEYATRHGVTLDRRRRRFYLPGHPYIGCTVDARAGGTIIEAKSSPWADYGEPGDGPEGLPLYVRVQVQHQMMVTGLELAIVPVLIRGYDYREFEVPRDPQFIADLRDELIEWHAEYVVKRVPPPVDDPEAVQRYLKHRDPRDDGSSILAPASLSPVFRRWAEAKRDEDDAKHRLVALGNILRDTMGPATKMEGAEASVSYKAGTVREVAWELIAGAYRKRLLQFELALGAGEQELEELLDAIESTYTATRVQRTLRVTLHGQLKELRKVQPREQQEESDAIAIPV